MATSLTHMLAPAVLVQLKQLVFKLSDSGVTQPEIVKTIHNQYNLTVTNRTIIKWLNHRYDETKKSILLPKDNQDYMPIEFWIDPNKLSVGHEIAKAYAVLASGVEYHKQLAMHYKDEGDQKAVTMHLQYCKDFAVAQAKIVESVTAAQEVSNQDDQQEALKRLHEMTTLHMEKDND